MKKSTHLQSLCLAILGLSTLAHLMQAGSATWNLNPSSGDWNTAENWTPNTVPNGPTEVATFGVSNTTAISIAIADEVNSIAFDPGAAAFTITAASNSSVLPLKISGTGVVNDSGTTQNFICSAIPSGYISFIGAATAGTGTIFTQKGGNPTGGVSTNFYDNASADAATFINEGGTDSAHQQGTGITNFFNSSTAANGTFINDGGHKGAFGGATTFWDSSTAADGTFVINGALQNNAAGGDVQFAGSASAGDAVFTCNGSDAGGGGLLHFFDSSTAANARVIANGGGLFGGRILFETGSNSGGTARIGLFGNGMLDVSPHFTEPIVIGSLEGNGIVALGSANLMIGSNDRDTIFSGVIQDNGGVHGGTGSITKIGLGVLTLTGLNTYTNGTTVDDGTLIVTTTGGSGVGTGPVQTNGGRLGATGSIPGPVTIGDDSGSEAFISSGVNGPGRLKIQSGLIFNSDGTYSCQLNANKGRVDLLIAQTVAINSGAQFSLSVSGNTTLPPGQVFTVLETKSPGAITGTFANLPDGGTITVGSNTFQANYEGGDGNDLTLTVVP